MAGLHQEYRLERGPCMKAIASPKAAESVFCGAQRSFNAFNRADLGVFRQ